MSPEPDDSEEEPIFDDDDQMTPAQLIRKKEIDVRVLEDQVSCPLITADIDVLGLGNKVEDFKKNIEDLHKTVVKAQDLWQADVPVLEDKVHVMRKEIQDIRKMVDAATEKIRELNFEINDELPEIHPPKP